MPSDVAICNRALRRLAQAPLTLLDGSTPTSAILLDLYGDTRDALVTAVKPRFAHRRANLAADVDAPAFGWSFRYPVPAGYLTALGLGSEEYPIGEPYVEEGGAILTDYPAPLPLRYVVRVTDPSLFTADFVDLLAVTLAAESAYAITGSATLAASLAEEAADGLVMARYDQALRGTPPPRGDEAALTRVRR